MSEWIRVEERAPAEFQRVHGWCGYVDMASYQDGAFVVFDRETGIGFDLGSVTHWMPLPEPPEENDYGYLQ